MKTIAEWQTAAYECARSQGFHDCRASNCVEGEIEEFCETCKVCNGTGLAPMTATRIGARLAAIHCEIAEATECVVRGKMELYYTGPCSTCHNSTGAFHVNPKPEWNCLKPEGFGIELADVFLRLCDLAESVQIDLPEFATYIRSSDPDYSDAEYLAAELQTLHWQLDHAWIPREWIVLGASELRDFCMNLYRLAGLCGVDLLAMAELKHEYNKTRPFRHGGKVL